MRLLVCTQAVDRGDQALGFFHRWLEEFSAKFQHVHVICLKEGDHNLPSNVSVYSLGKEAGRSQLKYLFRFYSYIWRLRSEHDAIFVHMNQEYVLMGGLFWRLLGKRIVLWRNHKKGSWQTRLAALLAHTVCYTSPDAYVATHPGARRMPIGVDTDAFRPATAPPPPNSVLFFGRLDPVKRVETFIAALRLLAKRGVSFHARICGDPTEPGSPYAAHVKKEAQDLLRSHFLAFTPAIPHAEAPALYASHAIYVNLTPSGSFDKTIGEAMACGCVAVVVNEAVKEALGPGLLVPPHDRVKVADAIEKALSLSPDERRRITEKQRAYIERDHSLDLLSSRLSDLFSRTV